MQVEYLSRVVQRCQKELPLLLHTVSTGSIHVLLVLAMNTPHSQYCYPLQAVEPYVEVAGDDLGAIKDINE